MPFERSALFTVAGQALQREVKRRFAASDYGQLIKLVERSYDRPASQAAIEGILRKWKGTNPRQTIEKLLGADFGSLVRTVEKYARGGGSGGLGKRLLMQFLKSMGPAGSLLKSLATAEKSPAGYRSSVNDAMALIRAMGGEVLPGKDWGSVEDVDRAVRAMQQRLNDLRARGEKVEAASAPPAQLSKRVQPAARSGDVPMAAGGSRRFPPDHPIVTGDMVPTPGSSNVYEFGYDADTASLFVRFKLASAPQEHVRPNAPGSLYRYGGVTPEEFLSLYKLRNHAGNGGGPGDWVWDNLRERGTVSGHKKPYELVGVMGGYVPRQARVLKNQQTGQLEEWFIPRLVPTTGGKWLRSRKPAEPAPTSGFMVGQRGVGGGPRSGPNNPRG
jgi:hypothetical protein